MNDQQFDKHWRQYEHSLFGYAFKRLKNRQDAEDLISQAQLKAYRHRDKLQIASNPYLWLIGIVKRLAIDHERRRSARVVTQRLEHSEDADSEPNLIDPKQLAQLEGLDSEEMEDRASIERIRARLSEAITQSRALT